MPGSHLSTLASFDYQDLSGYLTHDELLIGI